MSRSFWAFFLGCTFGLFLFFELLAYFTGGITLSRSVWNWFGDYWPLGLGAGAYGAGLLCGHLWWPQRR